MRPALNRAGIDAGTPKPRKQARLVVAGSPLHGSPPGHGQGDGEKKRALAECSTGGKYTVAQPVRRRCRRSKTERRMAGYHDSSDRLVGTLFDRKFASFLEFSVERKSGRKLRFDVQSVWMSALACCHRLTNLSLNTSRPAVSSKELRAVLSMAMRSSGPSRNSLQQRDE